MQEIDSIRECHRVLHSLVVEGEGGMGPVGEVSLMGACVLSSKPWPDGSLRVLVLASQISPPGGGGAVGGGGVVSQRRPPGGGGGEEEGSCGFMGRLPSAGTAQQSHGR